MLYRHQPTDIRSIKIFKPILQIVFFLHPITNVLSSSISRQRQFLSFEMVNYIPRENYNL